MSMHSRLLKIITPQDTFFYSMVEMIVIDEMGNGRKLIVPHSAMFRRLKESEVRFLEAGASEVRVAWIPGGHIHVGQVISIYTKYANWKKEKV